MKFITSPIYNDLKSYISDSKDNQKIFLFVPYIKTDTLNELLYDVHRQEVIIVTTWKPFDLLLGSSELSLYQFCQKNKFTLYINNNLHLKVYSRDLEDAILATANISRHGLGTIPDFNLECAIFVSELDNDDVLYFTKILHQSILVNDAIYRTLINWSKKYKKPLLPLVENFEQLVTLSNKSQFLISALPMTKDIDMFEQCYLRICKGLTASKDHEIKNCIFHDLANYKIDIGLSIVDFRTQLKTAFFSHPFIQKIDQIINPATYFGRIKEWIQNNCTDVPIPSRRELTGNVQVLLKWFETLGDGKYIVDIPGSHSQRIRKIT